MGKKSGKAALSLTLLGAGAIAFFGLGGTGYVKSAFGSSGESSSKTGTNTAPTTESDTSTTAPEPIPQESNNDSTVVFYPTETSSNKLDSRQEQIIDIENRNKSAEIKIIKQQLQKRKSTPARINVRRPEFVTKQEENPVKFNKRKFGTDDKLLESALSKKESKRSIPEKKQIENERAKLVFDSSKINNF